MIAMLALQTTEILAQGVDIDITPKAPAGSNGLVEILRIGMWIVIFAGIGAIMVGGGLLGWEKMNGGVSVAPKIISGALIGGVIATSAGGLVNGVIAAAAN
ncbi:hypothetical protein [Nocardia salmonicida]|uniref:hypothetical protein n=1 Tax=Nocardia salmonicida TaxID=53431 RepID=UPI0033F1689F